MLKLDKLKFLSTVKYVWKSHLVRCKRNTITAESTLQGPYSNSTCIDPPRSHPESMNQVLVSGCYLPLKQNYSDVLFSLYSGASLPNCESPYLSSYSRVCVNHCTTLQSLCIRFALFKAKCDKLCLTRAVTDSKVAVFNAYIVQPFASRCHGAGVLIQPGDFTGTIAGSDPDGEPTGRRNEKMFDHN